MQLFIGWSGDRSKAVAEGINQWLPKVIQAVEPWVSTEMERGANWIREVSGRLDASHVGIIVLTADNLTERWILFEAGALSKRFSANDKEHVCTLLVGVEPSQVQMPLSQFQATRADKDEVRKLVKTINGVLKEPDKPLPDGRLDEMFEAFWPELDAVIKNALAMPGKREQPKRTPEDMLVELLALARDQNGLLGSLNAGIQSLDRSLRPTMSFGAGFGARSTSSLRFISPELPNPMAEWEPPTIGEQLAAIKFALEQIQKARNDQAHGSDR